MSKEDKKARRIARLAADKAQRKAFLKRIQGKDIVRIDGFTFDPCDYSAMELALSEITKAGDEPGAFLQVYIEKVRPTLDPIPMPLNVCKPRPHDPNECRQTLEEMMKAKAFMTMIGMPEISCRIVNKSN